MAVRYPIIPAEITVHLGLPNSPAQNVTLPFLDYIANVASSEVYPTWPENALRANIYAEVSFALNRVFTEFYRSRGYSFDITSSTAYDQAFVKDRVIFENIYGLAAELFNDYIVRQGSVEPLFAQYCNGTTVTCSGLSQWGSVDLARRGYTPYEILQYYYGRNINLRRNAEVRGYSPSLPPFPLREGSVGDDVRSVQIKLNRVAGNFPDIPKIPEVDGIFDAPTTAAVKKFQRDFSLTPDGIVGQQTWYTLQRVFTGVKRLNSLESEGIPPEDVTEQYPRVLSEGSTGIGVSNLQYYLNYLSAYYNTIPPLVVDGVFGPKTKAAVIDAQNTFGAVPDGIVGPVTWNAIYRAYRGIVDTVPRDEGAIPFPGVILRVGSESEDVRILQTYLNRIARTFPEVSPVNPTGYFGSITEASVRSFQRLDGLTENGIVGPITWNAVADLYETLTGGSRLSEGQYPGFAPGAR